MDSIHVPHKSSKGGTRNEVYVFDDSSRYRIIVGVGLLCALIEMFHEDPSAFHKTSAILI